LILSDFAHVKSIQRAIKLVNTNEKNANFAKKYVDKKSDMGYYLPNKKLYVCQEVRKWKNMKKNSKSLV